MRAVRLLVVLSALIGACGPAPRPEPTPPPVPMCEAEARTVAESPPPEALCLTSARSDEAERAARLYQQERFVDAIAAAETALQAADLDPAWSSWLRFLIARSTWHQGDRERAEQILREMIASPYDPLRWSAARWLCQMPDAVPTSDSSDACPAIFRFPARAQ